MLKLNIPKVMGLFFNMGKIVAMISRQSLPT